MDAEAHLRGGEVEVLGRMPFSSNQTFLVEVRCGDVVTPAVYKPRRGERPLWDFPPGLDRREVAAYELSRHLGWDLVPPTVLRADAPFGPGSLQLFVDADFEQHYFTLVEDPARHATLRRICAFDLVGNNTDRKSGHCILGHDGRIRAIDNALMFHADEKVRTVIWDFGGEPLPDDLAAALQRLVDDDLPAALVSHLDEDEAVALVERAAQLLDAGRFPVDVTGRRYPWPLV